MVLLCKITISVTDLWPGPAVIKSCAAAVNHGESSGATCELPVGMYMGMSENGIYPNKIAIFHRDNDQQNHWVFRGTLFSDKPI